MERFELEKMVSFQPEKMAKVDVVSSNRLVCGLNCFEPGQVQKVHAHAGADKLYYVLEGSGEFQVGEEKRTLSQGELLYVPEEVAHGVVNTGTERLVVLIVISPGFHG
ncbi:MAG: cupin domain-containing protein [SAR324 cluster bacterium]|nr:cupin domain-containing protein [SAR324 cluster bacterium]